MNDIVSAKEANLILEDWNRYAGVSNKYLYVNEDYDFYPEGSDADDLTDNEDVVLIGEKPAKVPPASKKPAMKDRKLKASIDTAPYTDPVDAPNEKVAEQNRPGSTSLSFMSIIGK